jgi:predicted nuclease with TOPRIM domain
MYADDPKHEIMDPMEHILREMGINPPRKQLESQEDLREIKDENEDLKQQVLRLESQMAELQQELQNIQRHNKL